MQEPEQADYLRCLRSDGQYYGATIARDRAAHRIVIFQDTLERDTSVTTSRGVAALGL